MENGLEGGKRYADLVGWDRMANEALTIKALDELKYETMGLEAHQRFFIGYDKDDVSQVELSDVNARPRN